MTVDEMSSRSIALAEGLFFKLSVLSIYYFLKDIKFWYSRLEHAQSGCSLTSFFLHCKFGTSNKFRSPSECIMKAQKKFFKIRVN